MRIGLALIGLLASASAGAADLAITTEFSPFFVGSGTFRGTPFTIAANTDPITFDRTAEGYRAFAEASAVVTSDDDAGAFFFKHDLKATADATISMRTQLFVTITNVGPAAENLRFDSAIIPGHFALRRPLAFTGGPTVVGRVDFTVNRAGDETVLYSLDQTLNSLAIGPLDPNFNNLVDLRRYREPVVNQVIAYDWWYTPVAVELGVLAPSASVTIVYDLLTTAFTDPTFAATDPFPSCPNIQLSFGDPRARGSTSLSAGGVGTLDAIDMPVASPPRPDGGCARPNRVTDLEFDPALLPFSIVRSGTPFSIVLPEVPAPIDYELGVAVPAPSALALFGLAALGLAARRRGA